jgi:hypothetical protein
MVTSIRRDEDQSQTPGESVSLGWTVAPVVRGGRGAIVALVTAVLTGPRPGPVDEDTGAGRGSADAEPAEPVHGEVGGERGGEPGGERVIAAAACTPGERDVPFLVRDELWNHGILPEKCVDQGGGFLNPMRVEHRAEPLPEGAEAS